MSSSSRRPLQPIPAPSPNVSSARSTRVTTATTTKATDGIRAMATHTQDEAHDSGSVVSGLTSLSGDDEFERLMIQNARDHRRLLEARQGRAQPFRKARAPPRVGLTMDNLERNEAQSQAGAAAAQAHAAVKSPPSSSGSAHSDPAIHAPAGWGRKGRSSRSWMRTITRDEPQQPAGPDDSPLSHKSFTPGAPGTPRHDDSADWDLTFDMNEASMLASTPYIPRNTKLDDIREREMESLREQRLATARLDRIREHSPEEMRRPRSSAANSTGPAAAGPQPHEQGSPVRKLRRRTNSWQSLAKSQPELSQDTSPIAVYRKSVETVGVMERGVVASAERLPAKPLTSRRTDSQDLLRRLARASNTPSPQAVQRPHAAVTEHSNTSSKENDRSASDASAPHTQQLPPRQRQDTPHDGTTPDVPSSAPEPAAEAIDATPMPVEHTVLDPKTPLVMGGWIDTPGPRTAHKPIELPQPPSQSPKEDSPPKHRSTERPATAPKQDPVAQSPEASQPALPRPQLPSSALHALIQEARVSHDYGDDTIHSLEDLITPRADNETDEDTLQGLALPTSAPRTEAERERQAEAMQIHRLNQHLRATSTNIRDVSRGMRRVKSRMEHIEVDERDDTAPVVMRHLSADFSPWTWFRSFFWDERLKTQRVVDNAPLKMWGGVTLFGVLLTLTFVWWASETVACEMFCHPEYARYSPYPFAVNMDAPKRGVVIPTLVYRALFKSWSPSIFSPIASVSSWLWTTLWSVLASTTSLNRSMHGAAVHSEPPMPVHTHAAWTAQEEVREEDSWEWSMAEDEILRR